MTVTRTTMAARMPRLRIAADPGNPAQVLLCIALGAGFTLALFMGMAHVGRINQAVPPADIEDLRSVSLPFQPPPPPRVTPADPEPVSDISTVTGFDYSPSDSPVKIAVSPPNLNDIAPSNQVAPTAYIQIGRLYGEFKPKMGFSIDLQHVYQKSEVDTPPTMLYRAAPPISRRLFKDASVLRLTLLFVVETNGAITNVRMSKSSGNPEADAIVMETVQHDWGFTPAVKKGRKVRCMLMQPFRLELPRVSRYHDLN